MAGLVQTSASLLLNLEAVLTAVLALVVFQKTPTTVSYWAWY
ncbi:hypothetical protein [Vogesella indigofera]|nr:hypothetical protein [Vogesella indigofera]MDC7697622.1 hypothetical protein [Vogesella indigofera]